MPLVGYSTEWVRACVADEHEGRDAEIARQVVEATADIKGNVRLTAATMNEWLASRGEPPDGDPGYWREYKGWAVSRIREIGESR